ncbi:MAG: leucyl aminopeptidase [Actinomycetota bacterium]
MPKISLVDAAAAFGDEAVVIGVHSSDNGPVLAAGAEPVDAVLGGRLTAALTTAGATGKLDEVTKIPTLGLAPFPLVVASGVGPANGVLDDEVVRGAVGAAMRALGGTARVRTAIGDAASAAAEGALFGSYAFSSYKSTAVPPAARRVSIGVSRPRDAHARAGLRRAQVVGQAVSLTRDLVNTPPNDMYPAALARRATEVANAAGIDVEVLDEKDLTRGGYGGIVGVGAGSARPPRLVRLTYRPARPRGRVALIGKGITFDSGGYNLKPGPGMAHMKSDMGGAAAVIASMAALAGLQVPVEVIATVPIAENLMSGTAYRPSDVLTLRGGRTVEITNTDAEGRVVLADAIVRAVEDRPDYLIETSTLTGGQVVALGLRVIAAMGDPALRDRVVAAGNATGEHVWAMPLPDELRTALDSPIADLINAPSERWAQMLVAGVFLGDFVPDGLPWVHLDIAGPAYNPGAAHGYTPKGATGAVVRTLIAAVEDLAEVG